ncbi:MAG: ArsC/Spx/MgsR family protein [Candidatus Zixiibacteriota bacterium]
MAPKRAKFYTYGEDAVCVETQEFIENAGVILEVRDIEKNPLTLDELNHLFRFINIKHFLNTFSEAYSKYRLDHVMPPREKVIELMAQDHTLIRRPIIQASRLLTVGCDRKKISEMLQISLNGAGSKEEPTNVGNRQHRNNQEAASTAGK